MSRSRHTALAALALTVIALAAPQRAAGQSWGDRLKKRAEEAAKRATENRVDQRTTEATNAAMDKAEKTVKCAATDKACAEAARKAGKKVEIVPAGSEGSGGAAEGSSGAAAAPKGAKPGEGAWANYDFKPGDQPLFVDDFSSDEVGSFPRRLEFKSGSVDLVEWQGRRWVAAPGHAEILIPLARTLPERFTFEFDLTGGGNGMTVIFDGKSSAGRTEPTVDYLDLNATSGGIRSSERQATTEYGVRSDEQPVHVALMVDGRYAKLYVNERRIANVPNVNFGRSNKIYMDLNGWSDDNKRMITNIRVMGGGKKLYDALSTAGRVATQGIYFDTGSDRLRPESSPTLKEIGAMLNEHPDLKLTIEGHTDNVGGAATNLALSQKRAEAVRAALVASYGVDGDRLVAKGLGQTKPAGPNTTAEGRQQNRRVELVRM